MTAPPSVCPSDTRPCRPLATQHRRLLRGVGGVEPFVFVEPSHWNPPGGRDRLGVCVRASWRESGDGRRSARRPGWNGAAGPLAAQPSGAQTLGRRLGAPGCLGSQGAAEARSQEETSSRLQRLAHPLSSLASGEDFRKKKKGRHVLHLAVFTFVS